jgi:hypothetical protein
MRLRQGGNALAVDSPDERRRITRAMHRQWAWQMFDPLIKGNHWLHRGGTVNHRPSFFDTRNFNSSTFDKRNFNRGEVFASL